MLSIELLELMFLAEKSGPVRRRRLSQVLIRLIENVSTDQREIRPQSTVVTAATARQHAVDHRVTSNGSDAGRWLQGIKEEVGGLTPPGSRLDRSA
jgi:hypothetical protein